MAAKFTYNSYLALLLLVAFCSSSQENQPDQMLFQPAQLKNTDSSLQHRIKFPNSKLKGKENVVVRCDALLTVTGHFKSNYCYEKGGNYSPYVTAINVAAKHATIEPARINGHVHRVWFQYYVIFFGDKDKHTIRVVPNSGLEMEKYGFDYTSAQRYSVDSRKFGGGCNILDKVTVQAVINDKGKAVKVQV